MRLNAQGVECWHVDTVLSIGAVPGRWVAGGSISSRQAQNPCIPIRDICRHSCDFVIDASPKLGTVAKTSTVPNLTRNISWP